MIGKWRLFGPLTRPKNRAFRSKSSEAPMRFLWAFRYNPWRTHQRLTTAIAFGNCVGS
jgi:hypothetical protein